MRPKPYPPEKRRYLEERRNDVVRFIRELPEHDAREVAGKLPPIRKGFRIGQPSELQERLRRFALNMQRWSDDEWGLFQEIWLKWIRHQPNLRQIIDEYDNSEDFKGETPVPPNSELDIGCFKRLVDASREWKIARETISKFYTYGYFVPDERLEELISAARSEAELRPVRDIEDIKGRLQAIDQVVAGLTSGMEEIQNKQSGVHVDVKELSSRVKTLDEALQRNTEQLNECKRVIRKLEDQVRDSVEKWAKVEHSVREWSISKSAYEHRIEVIRFEFDRYRKDIEKQLEDLRQMVDHQSMESERVRDELKELSALLLQQFSEFEQRLCEKVKVLLGEVTKEAPRSAMDARVSYELAPRLQKLGQGIEARRVQSLNDARLLLRDNFRAIGVQSRAADALAVEVLAAVLAGEMVLFRGALASIVAEVCALTLAGAMSYCIDVPIGLLNSHGFAEMLGKLNSDAAAADRTVAVVINGVNLSPVEVYAGSVKLLVAKRLFHYGGAGMSPILLGTVAEGSAALPLSPTVCELGPIFNVDCVAWRSRWNRSEILAGDIGRTDWEYWSQATDDKSIDNIDEWEDELVKELIQPLTPLWKQALLKAWIHLSRFGRQEGRDTFQSILYGWVLPRAILLGRDVHKLEELVLEFGQMDGRVSCLLEMAKCGAEL